MSYSDGNGDCTAFIISGEKTSEKDLSGIIRGLIGGCKSIDADVFTYCGKTLVLARQTPPRMHRLDDLRVRLCRR